MKVLFVTDLCPLKEGEKGLPLTLLNFISDFKKLGAEVTLLRPNVIPNILIRKRKIYPDGVYNYAGTRCINKNFWTPFFRPSQFSFLKNEKFDIIFSHMPSGILAANKISKLLAVPYIASVHASDIKVLTDFKYFFLKKNMQSAYLEAKNVTPRSYWLKDKIEKIIPELKGKVYVVPSGIDSDTVINYAQTVKKIENFSNIPMIIFSAGSLIKRKNFDKLIEAVAKTEDVKLSIAGAGPDKARLSRLVEKLKLKERVKFLGQLSKEEVCAQMEAAPVFALVSSNETFGMVYLEALAKGCIVVCPENSGMAGFIKNGENGFLISEKQDLPALLDKIKNIENSARIIKNAVNTAENMDNLKMAQNYLNLAQNILF